MPDPLNEMLEIWKRDHVCAKCGNGKKVDPPESTYGTVWICGAKLPWWDDGDPQVQPESGNDCRAFKLI